MSECHSHTLQTSLHFVVIYPNKSVMLSWRKWLDQAGTYSSCPLFGHVRVKCIQKKFSLICTVTGSVNRRVFWPTWQDLIFLPPLLIFGSTEESGSGPGETVVGQPGVLLSDEKCLEETLCCLLIILYCDLEMSWKGFHFFKNSRC